MGCTAAQGSSSSSHFGSDKFLTAFLSKRLDRQDVADFDPVVQVFPVDRVAIRLERPVRHTPACSPGTITGTPNRASLRSKVSTEAPLCRASSHRRTSG